jgi:energy-coupling factor transport system ATP-binding protein
MQIDIDDLHFTYPSGVAALRGVSLRVEAGERLAIIGQNGSGKTTLARHLNGLLRPGRGTVTIGGWRTSDYSVAQLAQRVGYVFQNPDEQLCKRRVWDEVAFGPINLGFTPAQVRQHVEAALVQLDLEPYTGTNPHDLPPSDRRRVAIASVLAMATPIIVLDEPTTGQDQRFLAQLTHLLAEWQTQGRTVIAISHDIDFVAEQFERIVVLGKGQLLLDGSPAAVFRETDTLAGTFVQPPQLVRLAAALELTTTPLTVEAFLTELNPGPDATGPIKPIEINK